MFEMFADMESTSTIVLNVLAIISGLASFVFAAGRIFVLAYRVTQLEAKVAEGDQKITLQDSKLNRLENLMTGMNTNIQWIKDQLEKAQT